MRKLFVAFTVLLGSLAFVVASNPAGAAGPVTKCPQMTDSINRLYKAYFLRDPEPGANGYDYWLNVYADTPDGLAEMSNNFAISQEFVTRYGNLSDSQFVERVYQNVLERSPDAQGLAHWTNALKAGFPRGSVMISFSESEEFVNKTQTVAPVAGYLQWFQGNVRFTCNSTTGALQVTVNGKTVVNTSSSPMRPTTPAEPPVLPKITSVTRLDPVNTAPPSNADRTEDEVMVGDTVVYRIALDYSGVDAPLIGEGAVQITVLDPSLQTYKNYFADTTGAPATVDVMIPIDAGMLGADQNNWFNVGTVTLHGTKGGQTYSRAYSSDPAQGSGWVVYQPEGMGTHNFDFDYSTWYVLPAAP